MNIAHLLPYTARFPLTKHNGRYEWVLRLATLQAAAGHAVTIYAAPGSHADTTNIQWASHGGDLGDPKTNNLANIRAAFTNTAHDIYHSHFDFLHYSLAGTTPKPIVCTQHWFPNEALVNASRSSKSHNVTLVPVTHYMADADTALGLTPSAVIYHGIDLELFSYDARPKTERFVFVGRITPSKGVREAVALAKLCNIPLDIIGKINSTDKDYWNSFLPSVDGMQIRYLGAKTQTEVVAHLATARAMLFPLQVKEAFGQTTVEAQACGTPVIIQDLGASKELVQSGKTGFVVSTTDQYVEAIKNIDSIKPADCRAFAEKFNVRTMASAYDDLYEHLIK